MDIRDRILEAAKKVYAQHGFRGATTRLIAIEAGVNEVTLFRQFKSKTALINEAAELYARPVSTKSPSSAFLGQRRRSSRSSCRATSLTRPFRRSRSIPSIPNAR